MSGGAGTGRGRKRYRICPGVRDTKTDRGSCPTVARRPAVRVAAGEAGVEVRARAGTSSRTTLIPTLLPAASIRAKQTPAAARPPSSSCPSQVGVCRPAVYGPFASERIRRPARSSGSSRSLEAADNVNANVARPALGCGATVSASATAAPAPSGPGRRPVEGAAHDVSFRLPSPAPSPTRAAARSSARAGDSSRRPRPGCGGVPVPRSARR